MGKIVFREMRTISSFESLVLPDDFNGIFDFSSKFIIKKLEGLNIPAGFKGEIIINNSGIEDISSLVVTKKFLGILTLDHSNIQTMRGTVIEDSIFNFKGYINMNMNISPIKINTITKGTIKQILTNRVDRYVVLRDIFPIKRAEELDTYYIENFSNDLKLYDQHFDILPNSIKHEIAAKRRLKVSKTKKRFL